MFKDKCLLITGGTGSFGNEVLKRILKMDAGEIRIFQGMKKAGRNEKSLTTIK